MVCRLSWLLLTYLLLNLANLELLSGMDDRDGCSLLAGTTGTGKTAAYGIPVIQKTDASSKQTQAIILSPTRELCLQIADDLNSFFKAIKLSS